MKWKQLLEYLDYETDDGDSTWSFVSYTVKPGYAIEVDQFGNDKFLFVNYFQVFIEHNKYERFVFQLDRLPEDPFNLKIEGNIMEMEIPARIYKLLEQ